MAKTKTKSKKTTPKKSKFTGVVIKEFKAKGNTYKVGDVYDAIEKGSLEYLKTAGYLAG